MYLEGRKLDLLFRITEHLTHAYDAAEVRRRVGEDLLELLDADYFASFVWDPKTGSFVDRIALNMDEANLRTYDEYYQFHDPITHRLQQRRRATHVNEIMPQANLERTEFFNDFLKRDGLHWGMNLYAYDGDRNIGDLRIWRAERRGNFGRADVELLDAIRPAFTNALKTLRRMERLQRRTRSGDRLERAWLVERFALTPREAEITRGVFEGKSDARLASDLDIAYSTVRTHLKRIYAKLSVSSRTELIRRVLADD
ncbi:MAG: helix-turn-helix transcriptional regulator [Alphaproteobacteria bacterium]|nr:helix-turn-helix transcriptional regulator [Alphaproteobacteria bacterium]